MKSDVGIGLVDFTVLNPSVGLPETSSILSQLIWNPLVFPVGREMVPSALVVMLSSRLIGAVHVPSLLQIWSVVHWLFPHTHAPPTLLPSVGHRGLALHVAVAQNLPLSQPASPHLHASERIVVPSVTLHASSVVVPVQESAEAHVCPLKQVVEEHIHLSTMDATLSAHVSCWLHVVSEHVVSRVHKSEPQVQSLSVNADPFVRAQVVGVWQRLSAAVQVWPMPQSDEPQVHTVFNSAEASVFVHALTSLQVLVDWLQSWPTLHVELPHVHVLLTREVLSTLLQVVTSAHLKPLGSVARQV